MARREGSGWLDRTLFDLARQMRWSFLPPLMVYLAAGVSGLTAIVGTFFVKDYLGLSAAFLAGLTFWAGIPWALKMPLGHLVDLIWRWKALLVYLGAGLIAASLLIMYALIAHGEAMAQIMSREAWFVVSTLLAPSGYVVQDVVADAMTVEAVPSFDARGARYSDEQIKLMHTTMQTLGRFAIVTGLILVSLLNVAMFSGVAEMPPQAQAAVYSNIYLLALCIPAISVSGVLLATFLRRLGARRLHRQGLDAATIRRALSPDNGTIQPNWWILGGSLVFAAFTLGVGLSGFVLAQETIFLGSMGIVLFLMSRLLPELEATARQALLGTAIIIFVFRAVPLPGAGVTWFEIDVLGFDQQFLSILSLITAGLTLVGMVLLRPLMAQRSLAYLVGLLTLASGLLALPNIGLYYGIQDWTSAWSGGVVDARFIAILDTAIESPLGQISMIPMLAWIARSAPPHLKATFFAVMASFTNLALSASSLATKYLNQLFVVTREVRDTATGAVQIPADYSALGLLLICVAIVSTALPLAVIFFVQHSRLRTQA